MTFNILPALPCFQRHHCRSVNETDLGGPEDLRVNELSTGQPVKNPIYLDWHSASVFKAGPRRHRCRLPHASFYPAVIDVGVMLYHGWYNLGFQNLCLGFSV